MRIYQSKAQIRDIKIASKEYTFPSKFLFFII